MKRYRQIGYEEREKIALYRSESKSIGVICSLLKRHRSTIYRELKRNEAPPGQYWPDRAESLRMRRRHRQCRLDRDEKLREFVVCQLRCHYWSPEQIAGYLKHRQKEISAISHESIYVWLYKAAQKKEKLWKFLARHKSKRGLRKSKGAGLSRIPNRVSIHERPKVVNTRKQFGHWEGDLMSFRKNAQHALVLRERATMFTKSIPLPSKKALDAAQAVIKLLNDLPPKARRTLTLDNGGEFAAHHHWMEQLSMKSFFCDPYASWQKGGIENTNGRLRRDLPRNTDIKNMSQEEFDECIMNYNTTPRKTLGWLTPLEAMNKKLYLVALQT